MNRVKRRVRELKQPEEAEAKAPRKGKRYKRGSNWLEDARNRFKGDIISERR